MNEPTVYEEADQYYQCPVCGRRFQDFKLIPVVMCPGCGTKLKKRGPK